ncbi:MAG TPA: Hsp20/alpha crystallin family protein [Anaerolineales bacterium]|nr:Hsp20/alpha crystallin family protein [Anaerolineales bacterium]
MSNLYLTRYAPVQRRYRPIGFNGGSRLPVDVKADSEAYEITAAVPGLKAEDLQIEILEDVVTLRGKTAERSEENDGYLLREIEMGEFARSLRLPDPLDASKAEAVVENGVLTLRIPKAEGARPKTIKVKAH